MQDLARERSGEASLVSAPVSSPTKESYATIFDGKAGLNTGERCSPISDCRDMVSA
jgi:hypothetical protein